MSVWPRSGFGEGAAVAEGAAALQSASSSGGADWRRPPRCG